MFVFSMLAPSGQAVGTQESAEQYILQIAGGDREALSRLYGETHAAVYGFALSILKNQYDAEDVTHDAYLHIWSAAGSYRTQGKPLAWIFTITRNLAYRRFREKARVEEIAPENGQALFAAAPEIHPEDRLVLKLLLENLTDEERQIVTLHAMTGLKHREIADILNLKLSTVLSKYNRALKKLRNLLTEAEFYEKTCDRKANSNGG